MASESTAHLRSRNNYCRVFFCLKVDGPINGGGVGLISSSLWFTALSVVCYPAVFIVAPPCVVTFHDDTKNSFVAEFSACSTMHYHCFPAPLKHSFMAVTSKILSTEG